MSFPTDLDIDLITQPVSINTTLNSIALFTCEGIADDIGFRVNDEAATDENVTSKGFNLATSNNGGVRRAELQAIAYDHNNNTNVSCRATTDDPPQVEYSNTSVLLIQG